MYTFQVGHVKPQLNEQLIVGTWQLLLVVDTQLIAKLKFLIIPLSYWKTKRIDLDKAKEIIDGPSSIYHITEEMNKSWSKVVKSAIEPITHNQNRIGEDLDDWLDRLVYEHYKINEICDADDEIWSESKLQKCLDTPWSSLSPDSKADTRNLCQNY